MFINAFVIRATKFITILAFIQALVISAFKFFTFSCPSAVVLYAVIICAFKFFTIVVIQAFVVFTLKSFARKPRPSFPRYTIGLIYP